MKDTGPDLPEDPNEGQKGRLVIDLYGRIMFSPEVLDLLRAAKKIRLAFEGKDQLAYIEGIADLQKAVQKFPDHLT
jgi:hypothetical protein